MQKCIWLANYHAVSSRLNDGFCICILNLYKQLSWCGGIAEDIGIEHNGFSHSCQIDNQGNAQRGNWVLPFPLSCARDFQESSTFIYCYYDWIPCLLLTEKSDCDASLPMSHHWGEKRYRLDWESMFYHLSCLSPVYHSSSDPQPEFHRTYFPLQFLMRQCLTLRFLPTSTIRSLFVFVQLHKSICFLSCLFSLRNIHSQETIQNTFSILSNQ